MINVTIIENEDYYDTRPVGKCGICGEGIYIGEIDPETGVATKYVDFRAAHDHSEEDIERIRQEIEAHPHMSQDDSNPLLIKKAIDNVLSSDTLVFRWMRGKP